MLLIMACGHQRQEGVDQSREPAEDKQAKALLQGIWMDDETGEISFRVKGDTIYYPDMTSQPAYFCIVDDSLELGTSKMKYAIVKQSAHVFHFENQNGDVVRLVKSDDQEDEEVFRQQPPKVMVYTEVVKWDSVVMHAGERYHLYVAINPTKYKVLAKSYSDDGMEVENVYYDNIIHVSLYQGSRQLFSRDFRKQLYERLIPRNFLEQAVLSNMEFVKADAAGFHFNATLCIPDGASCYMVDNTISRDGQLKTAVVEN